MKQATLKRETKSPPAQAGPVVDQGLEQVEQTSQSFEPRPQFAADPPPVDQTARQLQRTPDQRLRQSQFKSLARSHGNMYAARLAANLRQVQRAPGGEIQRCPAPPVEKPPLQPQQDPGFKKVQSNLKSTARQEKEHKPAKAEAANAQAAAKGPANELSSQAAGNQVDEMSAQKPKGFDKQAFKAALYKAIENVTPKNQEEADQFKGSNKAAQVKSSVAGTVTDSKKESEKDIKDTTQKTPDTSKAKPKEVKALEAPTAGSPPAGIGAGEAAPKPRPQAEISLEHGKCEVDSQMKEAGVSEEQIKKSNEPEFKGALDQKKTAEEHASKAPQAFKADESAVLNQSKAVAEAGSKSALTGMHARRGESITKVNSSKGNTKTEDEAKRAKVAADIEAIYKETKDSVSKRLADLDGKVNKEFEEGEKAARSAFENYVEARMNKYKDERYSGLLGAGRWIADKFMGLPPEVNAFYEEGKKLYLTRMDGVIDRLANLVANELNAAKAMIDQGRQKIKTHVAGLSPDLQKIGKQAQQDIDEKFDGLEKEVDSKQETLIQDLAQKYVAARSAVDARISEMKEANKGLVDKAKEAIGGVIDTILKLKDMLLGVLARAAGVIDTIIKDPIKFLGNLVSGIKMGLSQFVGNIGTHLKKGLMGWLFGTLAEAGIELPQSFDLKGIFTLIMQVLGLTWANLRNRMVKAVGEKTVSYIEKASEIIKMVVSGGIGALWEFIKDKLSGLKDTVIDGIKDFVGIEIIKAGVTWLVSMLNPASAFIKACKMIYDVIMFFVTRGSQIMSLVNAVLDSVSAIAAGALGSAANAVENALAKALPVAISFLASLLGLGGIADKIKQIIQKIQAPVNKVIDGVIKGVVSKFKGIAGKLNKGVNWAKGKVKQGKDWANNKAKQGVDWAKNKAAGLSGKKKPPTAQTTSASKSEEEKKHAEMGKAAALELSKKPQGQTKYEDVRKVKESTAKELEARYNPQLKAPVKMVISFRPPAEDIKDGNLDFHIYIGPNDFNMDGAVVGVTGIAPEVGTYGDLKGSSGPNDQEAHHVPPKGLLNWIVGEAKRVRDSLSTKRRTRIDKENPWLKKLSKIPEDTYNPGDPLAAISVNKHTHIKKQGAPSKDVWRAHFGKETAKEVFKRLKDKGLTLIYRTKADELEAEDREELEELAAEAGESPTAGSGAAAKTSLSTQFFKTELNLALQNLTDADKAEVDQFQTNVGSVAKGAYVQANECVTVALEKSDRDGTKEERQGALSKLKGISRKTWESLSGVKDLNIFG